ncbi:MAG TPA: thioredoxin-disulfide reductase [Elusimicrobia bacterium]|nr:MAG: hypothetical protein A2278_06405 [Elusimicrobia bacterium RIFOXYA12_FULL_49_49]OGS09712.1 MAG: hypothetical protein A2204_02060 [Elusimicrobia bacterium RIFOXYA1_FULL_47_7]OGS10361.1 MAG: hypothetical protein A2386_04530 [Elusimicrobia bacterium RIFOXYB1_FULL_48_9]OGS16306.1 MAG: hypothetical protein A2251_01720 [Elusimicrobia bacterium RIFOXYA2_FULL_47_53]OGS25850.1 MAG: hypothetical protein A2339_03610 [Elusimicrobia bacterium RIFOXYB12_FULL_50_12]OGS31461.1 MAG: hypothetical protein
MTEKITYVNGETFDSEVLKSALAVVDFYSTECPPCEALAAKFEPLSELYGGDIKFVKVFRQENRALAESLSVKSSPTVLFFVNGRETGTRLTGGVKRSELIQNLDAMLNPKRAAEIKSKIIPIETKTDVLILGAGPAGLTAAIYTAQAKLNTIIIDRALSGGQVATTHQVSNFPGFTQPVAGYELMHRMNEQAKIAGAQTRYAVDLTRVDLKTKTVTIDGFETITAKKIIIATGSSPRELGVKGEKEFKGRGISYCATCDAKYFQDKDVVVIGGGNSAVEESLFISKFARKITIVHQFDKLQANKTAQSKAFADPKISFMFSHEPREFMRVGDTVGKVLVEDLKTHKTAVIACDGVFIFAGMKPNLEDLSEGLELDNWGYIKTGEDMLTNLPDVYAAGDVASKTCRQITTAVSDGTIAAVTISKALE